MTRQDILSVNYAGEDGRYSCWLDCQRSNFNSKNNSEIDYRKGKNRTSQTFKSIPMPIIGRKQLSKIQHNLEK